MIFDDLLKEFENGANSRVIAEKLFETFQHHEITPILKEIQKKIIEKNTFLKKILANNYMELLNCSQLVRGLTEHSSKIKAISFENQRVFSEFEAQLQEKHQNLLESEGKASKRTNYEENLNKIMKKILKYQRKRLFFYSGGLLTRGERILVDFQGNSDVFQVFNMFSDLKRENLSRISSFFADFLRGIEKNCEKAQFSQCFWGLFLYYFDQKQEIEGFLLNILKKIESLIENACEDAIICFENIIKFMVFLMKTLEDKDFLKTLDFAMNLPGFDFDFLFNVRKETLYMEEYEENRGFSLKEGLQGLLLEEFYKISENSLIKLKKRLEMELIRKDSMPISGFNFFFLKSLYFNSEVRNSYNEIIGKLPENQEVDFYQTIKTIWNVFFNDFLQKIDINLKNPILSGLLKIRNRLEKDEFLKYREKSEIEVLSEITMKGFENIMKTLGLFEALIAEARKIEEFYEEIQLEKGLIESFCAKIQGEFEEIRREILRNRPNQESIEFLRILLINIGFLKKLEEKVSENRDIALLWKKDLVREINKEIKEIFVVFDEEIDCFLKEKDLKTRVLEKTGLNLAVFPRKIDYLLRKINKIIKEIEKDQGKAIFSQDFFMKINAKIADFIRENNKDCEIYLKAYFELENDGDFTIKSEIPDSSLFKYLKFLRKELQEALLLRKSGFSLKNIAKNSPNYNFPLIDQSLSNEVLNLTLIPLFKAAKLTNNTQKKGNQIQQSQNIVSSIANKDEDYLSRMMEGLNNTMKGLGIKEKANILTSSYNSLFAKK